MKKKSHFKATTRVYVGVMLTEVKASAEVKSSLSFVPPLWLVRSLKCHPGIRLHADISAHSSPNDTVTLEKTGISNSLLLYGDSFLMCVTEKTPKWGKLTINVLNGGALECVRGIYNEKKKSAIETQTMNLWARCASWIWMAGVHMAYWGPQVECWVSVLPPFSCGAERLAGTLGVT